MCPCHRKLTYGKRELGGWGIPNKCYFITKYKISGGQVGFHLPKEEEEEFKKIIIFLKPEVIYTLKKKQIYLIYIIKIHYILYL